MKIGHYSLGPEHAPFIVAEMSGNHNQSLDRALALVDAAAQAGAHGLKLQTYTADTMTLDLDAEGFVIRDPKSLWANRRLHDLYAEAHTPWAWHEPIFQRAQALGMVAFSTPFDESAVDFLETLAVPAYKIASFEMTDLPLIRRVAATGKPIIMSTGMATLAEIDESVRTARAAGAQDLLLLKCTSTYPASPENTNLRSLPQLAANFSCLAGLSDHTMGLGAACGAVALGAVMVEKHFTLSRAEGGVDAAFSLEPAELAQLVRETARTWQALGSVRFGPTQAEEGSLAFRRSLYVVAPMRAGEPFSPENLRPIRPGFGLPPKYLEMAWGKKATQDLAKGTPLAWEHLG